ncbi:CapA family protein [Polymorphospora sp. NPDC050346]|uniref:CapA family protein n=1 Tax=Polymorphospora sp. NPDC050346 TaxID=3155780 RepID=UPI0033D8DD6D
MYSAHQEPRRRSRLGQIFSESPIVAFGAVLVVLVGIGLSGFAAFTATRSAPAPSVWQGSASAGGDPSGAPAPSATEPAPKVISMSATGDIVMGNAPNRLPPNGGQGFFDPVKEALVADLVMGNLEEPLTEDTGTTKCGAGSSGCHAFRAPPSYAAHLRDAGFDLLNLANNHGYDYGQAGYENTTRALEEHGMQHTGRAGQITIADVDGVKVAVLGFTPYSWTNNLVNIEKATEIVEEAAGQADLVVVQVHMGAEGADRTRVKPGTEMFLGENRGDPIKFSHAVIDAGADLVVGHGPHVMRALEFYKGRLIAYSLGNFAGGGGTLNGSGRLGYGAVLKVSMTADGTWSDGQLISTIMNGSGLPTMDDRKRGLDLVRGLCESDFPTTAPTLDGEGRITPPAGG